MKHEKIISHLKALTNDNSLFGSIEDAEKEEMKRHTERMENLNDLKKERDQRHVHILNAIKCLEEDG